MLAARHPLLSVLGSLALCASHPVVADPAANCTPAPTAPPVAAAAPSEAAAAFAYTLRTVTGTELAGDGGRLHGAGPAGFRLVLEPADGAAWDMRDVALLGLEFHNTGPSELVIDLRLANANATAWSHSALGRTIVLPGESLPLVIGLPRAGEQEPHPAFLKMSGWPDGRFHHWQNIDPQRVVRFEIQAQTAGPHRFALGQLHAVRRLQPQLLDALPFIDQFGQYMHGEWPGKVQSVQDLQQAIVTEAALAARLGTPPDRSRFGGWLSGPRLAASGRFRVEQVDGRWWFVDPDGFLFWSHGVTGVGFEGGGRTSLQRDPRVFAALPAVDDPRFAPFFNRPGSGNRPQARPSAYSFSLANLMLKYGPDWQAAAAAQELVRVRYSGINTLAAWSASSIRASARMPYTAMIHFTGPSALPGLPDPFDPLSRAALRRALRSYPLDFKDDPYCLGVFINNELHWSGNASSLITGLLTGSDQPSAAKRAVRDWLQATYGSLAAFNAAWHLELADWDALLGGLAGSNLKSAPVADCAALALLFADQYYRLAAEELDAYAPDVLDLGSRFHVSCPQVIQAAAKYVDVISANVYQYDPVISAFGRHGKPVIIAEFHFGNLTGNTLGSGLRSAQDATQQARLLAHYLEQALSDPAVVGAHWFQWRDQSVGGRPDGENYAIGLFDVGDMPNIPLIEAFAELGRNLYAIRAQIAE
jgi:hypothetical protein